MGKVTSVSPFAPSVLVKLPPIEGVAFATAEAGIRYKKRTDLLLAVLDEGTSVAGVLTQSKTASAPVLLCRKNLKKGSAQALVVNSGNANAFTGKRGARLSTSRSNTRSKPLDAGRMKSLLHRPASSANRSMRPSLRIFSRTLRRAWKRTHSRRPRARS